MQGPPPPPGQITSNESSSKAAMILAALLPLPTHFIATGLLLLVVGGVDEFARAFEAAGPMAPVAFGAGFLAAIANTVLLALCAKGARIPPAIAVAIAAVPWLVGLFGVWTGTSAGAEALLHVNPADRATIAAASISEALYSRIIGGWIGGAQLAAVGLGLAIAALGRRAPGRSGLGTMLAVFPAAAIAGVLLAVPLLGAVATAMLLPAVVVTVLVALAGWGAGNDEHGRSGALATAAAFSGALSIGAVSAVVIGAGLAEMFGAVAYVNPEDKATILIAGALEVDQGGGWLRLGAWSAVIGAVGMGVWSLLRGERGRRSLPSFVVTGMIALAVLLADPAVVAASSNQLVEASASRTGLGLEAARLVQFDTVWEERDPALLLHADGALSFGDGTRLPAGDAGRPARIRAAVSKDSGGSAQIILGEGAVQLMERVPIAIEEGASVEAFAALARELQQAGLPMVDLIGASQSWAGSPDELDRAARLFPFVRELANQRGSVQVYLPGALPTLQGEEARIRWHGTVGGGEAPLKLFDGPSQEPTFEVPLTRGRLHDSWRYEGNPRRSEVDELLHLEPGKGAAVQDLLNGASRVSSLGYRVVLHPDGIDREALQDGPSDEVVAVGLFSGGERTEEIKRIVQGRMADIRACYERQLAQDPALQGTVVLQIVIGMKGTASAEVKESTLRNDATEACVVDVVEELTFPGKRELVHVNYPFVFKPAE